MVASAAGDRVRDDRTNTFAHEATLQLQRPGYGFPCRVDSSSGQLGVFATRRVLAGETVAVERPLALTVNRAVHVHTCAVCLADSRDAGHARWSRECEACHAHFYCGEACEVAGLARHRGVECEALALLRSDTDDDDLKDQVAQAVRILADRAAGRSVDAGPAGIASYASYVERLVGVPPWTAEARASLKTAVAATLRCVRERARVTPHELEDLLMRHQCNLYGVTGRAGEDKASASFVGFLHLFNHACCPNVVFDSARPAQPATAEAGPLFALRALTDVAEGAELCISYTSSAEGPVARAAHLEEWYSYPYQHNIYPIRIRVSRVDVMLALLSVPTGMASSASARAASATTRWRNSTTTTRSTRCAVRTTNAAAGWACRVRWGMRLGGACTAEGRGKTRRSESWCGRVERSRTFLVSPRGHIYV